MSKVGTEKQMQVQRENILNHVAPLTAVMERLGHDSGALLGTVVQPLTTSGGAQPSCADGKGCFKTLRSFYGIEDVGGEVNALKEPEFIETEMTLDTGATSHAADRLDFPAHEVQESAGSKAGQRG